MASGIFTLKQQEDALIQGAWSGQKTPAVDYLVIAGGGGGGKSSNNGDGGSGGGGAGGFLQGNLPVAAGTSITVTVGGGGAGGAAPTNPGSSGSNSVFSIITSTGGGGGGRQGAVSSSASNGGSGGGAGYLNTGPGGTGTFGQGNYGGQYISSDNGAGGGGAGTMGASAINTLGTAGNGGVGAASEMSGIRTAYAGGGGGGQYPSGGSGAGGAGGGGAGGNGSGGNAGSGTANTGSGGGGSGGGNSAAPGTAGSGGSGVVIISYPDTYPAAASTTGSPTVSTSGSGAISFSGTSQYIQYADNAAFDVGSGDFTIECWVYRNATGEMYFVGQADASATTSTISFLMFFNSSNQLSGGIASSGTTYLATAATSFTNSAWTHVALARDGNTLRLYSGGTQVGTASVTGLTANNSSNRLGVGCLGQYTSQLFNGYITNLRIVKGTCLYPSGTAFTPSTTPLTAISGTSILLLANSGAFSADSSTNAFFAAALGNSPTWTDSSPFSVTGYKNRVYKWTSSGSITF